MDESANEDKGKPGEESVHMVPREFRKVFTKSYGIGAALDKAMIPLMRHLVRKMCMIRVWGAMFLKYHFTRVLSEGERLEAFLTAEI